MVKRYKRNLVMFLLVFITRSIGDSLICFGQYQSLATLQQLADPKNEHEFPRYFPGGFYCALERNLKGKVKHISIKIYDTTGAEEILKQELLSNTYIEYDTAGRIVCSKEFDTLGKRFDECHYIYKGNQLAERVLLNTTIPGTEVWDTVRCNVPKLRKNITDTTYDATEYTNKPAEKKKRVAKGNNEKNDDQFAKVSKHDAEGRLVEEKWFNKRWKPYSKRIAKYDGMGNLIEFADFYYKHDTMEFDNDFKIKYDNWGRCAGIDYYEREQLSTSTLWSYDYEGNLTRCDGVDYSYRLMTKDFISEQYAYKYDNIGNAVEERVTGYHFGQKFASFLMKAVIEYY